MVKKSLIPYRMGELSYVYFYPFFGHKRLPMKKSPQWSILRAFRLYKIESTIEHLPSWARQKSTRSYHNGVPRHHPTEYSLETSPHSSRLCSEYFIMCLPWIPSVSKVSTSSKYFPSAVTFPVLSL